MPDLRESLQGRAERGRHRGAERDPRSHRGKPRESGGVALPQTIHRGRGSRLPKVFVAIALAVVVSRRRGGFRSAARHSPRCATCWRGLRAVEGLLFGSPSKALASLHDLHAARTDRRSSSGAPHGSTGARELVGIQLVRQLSLDEPVARHRRGPTVAAPSLPARSERFLLGRLGLLHPAGDDNARARN